jgi:predicted amidohydrolase YtcJ
MGSSLALAVLVVILAVKFSWFLGGWRLVPRGGDDVTEQQKRSRLFYNCHFWTGENREQELAAAPGFDAMLSSSGGEILKLGRYSEIREEDHLEEVDLGGKFCIPGLVDAHAHMILGGSFLKYLDLGGVTSKEEFTRAVKQRAEQLKPNEWLFGHGWDENTFLKEGEAGGRLLPSQAWINEVTPDNPVCLTRADGHMVLVNDVALDLASLSSRSKDLVGGIIERDPQSGELTGILKDSAINVVRKMQPELTREQKKAAIRGAIDYALSNGVTTVSDMGTPLFSQSLPLCMEDLYLYHSMAQANELAIRIYACVPLDGTEDLLAFIKREGWHHSSQMLFWGCVKEFYDGSLGSETALMHEPYTKASGEEGADNTGLRIHQDGQKLDRAVRRAESSNLTVIMHAIGDRAVDEAVSMLGGGSQHTAAKRSHSSKKKRHRIEHVQHISGDSTLAALGKGAIISVVNPIHLLYDANVMLEKLGRERSGAKRSYPFRSMLLSNLTMAFGSDWPLVAPLEPLSSVFAATERIPNGWAEAFVPEEVISRREALAAVTSSAALASSADHLTGKLSQGLKADFVVLDQDPLKSKDKPTVLRTYVNGECKFRRM